MNFEHYTTDDFLMDDSFVAYCLGTDPEAMEFWWKWQQSKPANLLAFQEAEQLYGILSGHKPRLNESFNELQNLIAQRSVQMAPTETKVEALPVQRAFRRYGWVAAASLLLVSGLAGFWFWRSQPVVYTTDYGQQKAIVLPDGSTVTLNSHSKITYGRHWDEGQSRDVTLEGEGYFSIRHLSTNAPFRVLTGEDFAVRVLGTEFTVTHRKGLDRVVLSSGKVQVTGPAGTAPVILTPGQLAELDAKTGQLVQRTVQPERYNAWLRAQLVFNSATLPDAIQQIQEQFGIEVHYRNTDISDRRFTGILPLKNPEKVLKTVATYHGLRVIRRGNVYELIP